MKKMSVPSVDLFGAPSSPCDLKSIIAPKQLARRKMSDPDIHYGTNVLANLVSRSDKLSAFKTRNLKMIFK